MNPDFKLNIRPRTLLHTGCYANISDEFILSTVRTVFNSKGIPSQDYLCYCNLGAPMPQSSSSAHVPSPWILHIYAHDDTWVTRLTFQSAINKLLTELKHFKTAV